MKILHIDTATEWRGGQNQIVLTAVGQRARGHQVEVFANPDGPLAVRGRAAGLSVPERSVGRGDFSLKTLGSVRGAVRSFAPDVLHIHESHGLMAALLAVRGMEPRPRMIASRRVDFPLKAMSRFKYGRMDKVLAVSNAVCDVLIHGGLPAEKVLLVHEGVNDRPPVPGGRKLLAALGVPEGAPVVGNVAQLVDHKDHATLIRAAAQVLKVLPDCRFVICGDGPLKASLMGLAGSLGIGEQILFAGFRPDLDALIPAFDIFCLSSHLEGLGTSVLDAMCFSRPVVATRAGGIPDAVLDGQTGRLVAPRDHQALADALLETLASDALKRRYGLVGRARFLRHLTSDAMVDATLAAYA
ncbi:MAG: glycosyltransferase family 4 protein [Vicinamibacteria bacterium]